MLRVATYNVHGLRDDGAALLRVLRRMRPDLLCLQEAPRRLRWRARRRELAHAAGLTVIAGRRRGGTAILAGPRVRLRHAETRLLRPFPGLERRALTVAVVELAAASPAGARLAVGCVHLDLHGGARLRHTAQAAAVLAQVAARFEAAAVLAGDVNEPPGGPVWGYLAGLGFTDCHAAAPRGGGATFPARRPGARIDAVFAGPGTAPLSAGVPEADPGDLAAASDHLPVLAELRLLGGPERHDRAPGAAGRTICS